LAEEEIALFLVFNSTGRDPSANDRFKATEAQLAGGLSDTNVAHAA
jgi:hypothetical protein